MDIHVNVNGFARWGKPVEVQLETDRPIANVIEIDREGTVIDPAVPFQHDPDGRLVFLLSGATPAGATRRYHLEFGRQARPAKPLVTLLDGVEDEGQESYQVGTPSATWLYHKLGAGFSSLIDRDGLDWLSYRPGGGSAGEYRGIPNIGHPEGYCHPGKMASHSRIVASGPLCASIESASNDGVMRCRWDIYPHYARLTVLQMRTPYWFLYEGTPGGNPGGQLDEVGGSCVRSEGMRTPLSERWEGPLPAPEWLYFGASNVRRVLYLVHHEADEKIDSYWPMEHNMTVFGFGRLGLEKFMMQVPAHFTVGLAEDGTFEHAQATIDSAFRPLSIDIS
jgi:hypothetical protein